MQFILSVYLGTLSTHSSNHFSMFQVVSSIRTIYVSAAAFAFISGQIFLHNLDIRITLVRLWKFALQKLVFGDITLNAYIHKCLRCSKISNQEPLRHTAHCTVHYIMTRNPKHLKVEKNCVRLAPFDFSLIMAKLQRKSCMDNLHEQLNQLRCGNIILRGLFFKLWN